VTGQRGRDGNVGIAVVDGLQRAGLEIGERLRPRTASRADDHRRGEAPGFLRVERDVKAAEDDGDRPLAEASAQLVRAGGRRRHDGDADQVHRPVPRDLVDLLVDDRDLVPIGRQRGDAEQRQHREAEGPAVEEPLPAETSPPPGGRGNQQDPHALLPPGVRAGPAGP